MLGVKLLLKLPAFLCIFKTKSILLVYSVNSGHTAEQLIDSKVLFLFLQGLFLIIELTNCKNNNYYLSVLIYKEYYSSRIS